jgi:hypothetical protein
MADTPTKVKPGHALVTDTIPFCTYPVHGDKPLFQVMPGIPLVTVVGEAWGILDAIRDICSGAVKNSSDISTQLAWLIERQTEQAQALLQSIEEALEFQTVDLTDLERSAA